MNRPLVQRLAAILIALLCAPLTAVHAQQTPAEHVALAVRQIERLPSDAETRAEPVKPTPQQFIAREKGGWPWLANKPVLISNADIISAQAVPAGANDADDAPHLIRITLSPRAKEVWGRTTRELVDKDIGVFLNDQLQGGITLRTAIGSGKLDFRVPGASKAELQRVAAGLMKSAG